MKNYYEIDGYEKELDLPYSKISVRLGPHQHGAISFPVKAEERPYAIRMFAKSIKELTNARFLITKVFSGNKRMDVVQAAPDPLAPVLSDVFFRTEYPVLMPWAEGARQLTFHLENILDYKILATIVVYFIPMHKTSAPVKLSKPNIVENGTGQDEWDERWIRKNLDGSKERIVFDRDEVLKAMRAVRQHILVNELKQK